MDIQVNDTYRVKRMDEKNLVVETMRGGKWRQVNGSGRGPYFARHADALAWLLNHRMINDSGDLASVEDAVAEMRRIADELKAAVAS